MALARKRGGTSPSRKRQVTKPPVVVEVETPTVVVVGFQDVGLLSLGELYGWCYIYTYIYICNVEQQEVTLEECWNTSLELDLV